VKNERAEDDAQYFVTCTYCGTQTQLSFNELQGGKPLKCRTCGAPFKVVPPPKKPVKKKKKPFEDYDAILAERQAYEMRTAGEFKKAQYVIGAILGALFVTIILFIVLLQNC
jgi:DNA-directed RNA polymerase subunit RPC12/RpoP